MLDQHRGIDRSNQSANNHVMLGNLKLKQNRKHPLSKEQVI